MEPAALSEALRQSFAACDEELFASVEAGKLQVGCGACALCVLVDASHIVVANAGDCQAVLIRADKAIPVSTIHNADQPAERRRLKQEHPDEPDVVVCKRSTWRGRENILSGCYVKDILQPTRALGDFYLKHEKMMTWNKHGYALTPPYITATPEVRVFARQSADQVLIMASDGFWDEMSGQEAAIIMRNAGLHSLSAQGIADTLLAEALGRVSAAHGMSEATLRAVPTGPMRRRMHDDITVLVVQL